MMEPPCRRFRVAAATAFVCSCSASVGALPVFLWGSVGVFAMRDWVGMLGFPPGALCASCWLAKCFLGGPTTGLQ